MTQNYQAKIYVTLRPSVLDPAGTAVRSGLSHMGYDNIDQVRIGKYVELNIDAQDEKSAKEQSNLQSLRRERASCHRSVDLTY